MTKSGTPGQLEVCYEHSHGQGFLWCSGTVVKVSDGTNIVVNGKVTKLHKANEAVLVKWDATESEESCVTSQELKDNLHNKNNPKNAWRCEEKPVEMTL